MALLLPQPVAFEAVPHHLLCCFRGIVLRLVVELVQAVAFVVYLRPTLALSFQVLPQPVAFGNVLDATPEAMVLGIALWDRVVPLALVIAF